MAPQVPTYKGLPPVLIVPQFLHRANTAGTLLPKFPTLIAPTGTLSTQVPYFKGLPPYLERQVDVLLIVHTGTISGSPHTFNTQVPTLNGLPHTLTTQVLTLCIFKWYFYDALR